jgi:hypothetical protein
MLQITRNDIRKCRVIWRTDDTLGVEFTPLNEHDQPEERRLPPTIAPNNRDGFRPVAGVYSISAPRLRVHYRRMQGYD